MARLDIVLMGATGFTGKYCIPYIQKLSKTASYNYTWGVAGRSEKKLLEVLEQAGDKIGVDLSKTPVITCNVNDEESLLKMAQKARLVINCVGPYLLYGEKVVDACLKAGTHHIDISGEPQYMEKMQLLKHETAKEKGVYIISACGFDSIPCDLGVVYLQQNFDGVLNSVVTYLEGWTTKDTPGPILNAGTWSSVVHNLDGSHEIERIRRELFPQKSTDLRPKLKIQKLPHRSNVVEGWALPFPGGDRSVVQRTQRYLHEFEHIRPVQVDTLFILKSIFNVILITILGGIMMLLSRFSFGKRMLLQYPQYFSFGYCSNEQPSEETTENTWFQITFAGEGWKDKLANKDDQYSTPCDKKMVARVKGRNPGYGSTCACLVSAAMVILSERDKLAGNGQGGVYTPGAAFAKTSLIKLLIENEVTFDIIKSN